MKLVTLDKGIAGKAGVILSDDAVLDLEIAGGVFEIDCSGSLGNVITILEGGLLDEVRRLVDRVEESSSSVLDRLAAAGAVVPSADIRLRAPVTRPSFILSQGLAYRAHLDEMGVRPPAEPAALVKAPSSVIGSGQSIILPSEHSEMVDYEGEFSVVIGRPCHNVTPGEVMDCIAGYTIINDVSARDWAAAALAPDQKPMQAVFSWNKNVQGKQFPTFTPMGPALTTKDEITDHHDLRLMTELNGEVMQDANTNDLIFRIEDMISYFSKWYQFAPGDVITTGTPGGVGHGRNPRVYLKDGDLIEITVTGVGTLSNTVVKKM